MVDLHLQRQKILFSRQALTYKTSVFPLGWGVCVCVCVCVYLRECLATRWGRTEIEFEMRKKGKHISEILKKTK